VKEFLCFAIRGQHATGGFAVQTGKGEQDRVAGLESLSTTEQREAASCNISGLLKPTGGAIRVLPVASSRE
jgi:hypothetical protein